MQKGEVYDRDGEGTFSVTLPRDTLDTVLPPGAVAAYEVVLDSAGVTEDVVSDETGLARDSTNRYLHTLLEYTLIDRQQELLKQHGQFKHKYCYYPAESAYNDATDRVTLKTADVIETLPLGEKSVQRRIELYQQVTEEGVRTTEELSEEMRLSRTNVNKYLLDLYEADLLDREQGTADSNQQYVYRPAATDGDTVL